MKQLTDTECANNRSSLWNKGKIIGQQPPLKPQDIWSIRALLKMKTRFRDLALINLAIDRKLRACDLVNMRAVQLLLGHTKIESTVRCLGVKVDDALDMAEHMEN
jgi:hypothetical protein